MPASLKPFRPALEPLVAVVYLVLWIVAEGGRYHGDTFALTLFAYAASIGLARIVPWASLSIVLLIPLLQSFGLLGRPESTTWAIAGASILVAFFVALSAPMVVKWAALVVVVCQAGIVSMILVFSGDWVNWNTAGAFTLASGDAASSLALGAVGAVFGAAGWLAGLVGSLTTKRRHERTILAQTESELVEAGFELRSVKERTEIAQEVHDVLAHSLAVVVAVADGSRFLREQKPETTDRALREIADTARSALIDLRGLIEGLHDEASKRPQPGLDDISSLVRRLAAAGMPVRLESFGTPLSLTRNQELAAYRIVQESLTNALKHGGGHPAATVSLNWEGPGLALTVTSVGDTRSAVSAGAADARRGYGLRNMNERARLAGGWLASGFDDAGGEGDAGREGDAAGGRSEGRSTFVVTAYIPANATVAR